MALTREQWSELEKTATSFYAGPARLMVDGYCVTLMLERDGPYKNVIAVYVDGEIKGSWMADNCEQRRRFFCPAKARLSKLGVGLLKYCKKYDKPRYREMMANPPMIYTPYWRNFNALRRHLIKHNTSIELMSEAA